MAGYRVLLLDGIDPAGVDIIRATNIIEPIVHDKISRDQLRGLIGEVDGLIVRSGTAVDRELIQNAKRLRVVGRAGVGVDNVDLDAATEHGVLVMNSPGGSTTTTAEHTVAMLFAMARNIPQAYKTLQSHKWEKSKFKGIALAGKTLGVIGLGRIGSEVARKCQAMAMNVIAYDPYINPDAHLSSGLELVDLQRIFEQADFITVHVPLSESTRNLINERTIADMKDGVRILNCARGGIVNESDLYAALKSGQVERYQHFVGLATRLAAFIAQICDGRMQTVSIHYSGEVCDMNLNYLTSIIVSSLLAPVLREGINLINAMHVAKLRGIKVQETRLPAPENFTNLIVIELKTDRESHRVSGTVFTDKLPRIVNVDGYPLEVVPHGNMIFFTNDDKPGVIGGIGSVLGRFNVNIAGMHLGREDEGGKALALLLVDSPVSNDVIERFRLIPNILSAKVVHV